MAYSQVAIVRCAGYNPDTVLTALQRGIALLGGIERFVHPGERILLKPNILAGDEPDKAVTTHPAVLAGCVHLLRQAGAAVSFGDSPGLENAVHAAKRCGLEEAGLSAGAELGNFTAGSTLDNPGGQLAHTFPIVQAVHECDGIINLPKMKTHQLTRITGAVKNLFGCIPGKRKALYHVQFQDVLDFSRFLVELNLRLRPRLHILDGVIAMEGNGPRSGDPRPMGVLVMSDDPIAVDATFARLVDLEPTFVPTLVAGQQAGLGRYVEQEIEYVGDPLAAFIHPDFKVIRKPVYSNASYAYFNTIKKLCLPRPVIDPSRCVQCGLCVNSCPVPDKALRFREQDRRRPPEYHYDLCIRCYCCHEMCPQRAIERKTPWVGRMLRLG